MVAPVPPRADIIQLYRSGELARELSRCHKQPGEQDDPFVDVCVDLHNAREIDLLVVPSQSAFVGIKGHKFFVAQQFYCDAIPKLDTSARAVMECCRKLIEQAGQDGAAGRPYEAFRLWCQNNPDEAAEVISDARAGDELAKQFSGAALQASGDAGQAISFVRSYDDDRRLSGIKALAGTTYPDDAAAHRAVLVLQPFVADASDDSLRMGALLGSFDILKKYDDMRLAGVLLDAATQQPGPHTLYGLAQIVWMNHARLDADTLRKVARALEGIKPEQHGTVNTIDLAMLGLLGGGKEEVALDLLTALVAGGIPLGDFDATVHELSRQNLERLYRLTVRWLLSGRRALCNAAADLVVLDAKRPFDASVQPLGLTPEQQYFLCRKAVGYMLAHAVACCSIIVSVLRGGDATVSDQASESLFDPILVSYTGEARAYLDSIAASDSAYGAVRKALSLADKYAADLEAVGVVKELHPTEYQRDVMRQRAHDESRDIHKRARESWDAGTQALRPSLNQILDNYIRNRIPKKYEKLKIVICVVFGGDMHEQVRTDVTGFKEKYSTDRISFDEWNGDKLAGLLMQGILREQIMPKPLRSHFQKAVALVDEPEIAFRHFERLVSELCKGAQNDKSRVRVARQLYIATWVLFVWARDVDNLEAPYQASELLILHIWNLVRPYVDKKPTAASKANLAVLQHAIRLYVQIASDLLEKKILPHVGVTDGISVAMRTRSAVDVNLKLFDLLGRIAVMGLWLHWLIERGPDESRREAAREHVLRVTKMGYELINNNRALFLPLQDRQGTHPGKAALCAGES